MAEQLLDRAQVGAALEQVGRRGVAQPVRARCRAHPGPRRCGGAPGRAPPAGRCACPGRRGRPRDRSPRRVAPGGRARARTSAPGPPAARRARSAPCAPCRTPAPPGGRRRGRRRRARPAPPPGCRSRRGSSSMATSRRPDRAAVVGQRGGGADQVGGLVGAQHRREALVLLRRAQRGTGVGRGASGALQPGGEDPRRRGATGERGARQAEGLLLGQPGAQGPEVEVGDVRESEPVRVVEQRRDVPEVGPDRVAGEVAARTRGAARSRRAAGRTPRGARRARRPLRSPLGDVTGSPTRRS